MEFLSEIIFDIKFDACLLSQRDKTREEREGKDDKAGSN